MMIGHKDLQKTFQRLVNNGKLSHGYIFFGEPQTGKFTFAISLANYLEAHTFLPPHSTLSELHIVSPDEKGTISIDAIRGMKYFLSQKAVSSQRRVAVVDDAQALTREAQHALLKITEEPPKPSLIILVLPHPDVLLRTIQSRLQKVYFPRVQTDTIARWLTDEHGVLPEKAKKLAELSFGRPGLAADLAQNKITQSIYRDAYALLRRRKSKADIIRYLMEHPEKIQVFFTALIAELGKEPVKNYRALKSLQSRLVSIAQFNTNKRLQLEAALWAI